MTDPSTDGPSTAEPEPTGSRAAADPRTTPDPGAAPPTQPRMARWVVGMVLVVGFGWLLLRLQGVLTPVLLALLIAYLLDPAVDALEARGLPRAAGIAIILGIFIVGLAALTLVVLPGILQEVAAFSEEFPSRFDAWITGARAWLAAQGLPEPTTLDGLWGGGVLDDPGTLAQRAVEPISAVFGWLAGGTASVLGTLTAALLVPVFAIYLLYDFDHLVSVAHDLIPHGARRQIVSFAKDADEVIGHFIRGQLLVMAILAVLYSVAYSLLGVRLAIAIGVVGGLVSFIPYLGGALALGLALVMVALHWQGWPQLVGVIAAYAAIQGLEGFYITPKVVGDRVGLPAVWVLLALLIFGELFGFLGVLLAVPAAAVIRILLVRGIDEYRQSGLYGGPRSPGVGTAGGAPPDAEGATSRGAPEDLGPGSSAGAG